MGTYNPEQLSPMHKRQLRLLSDGAGVTEVAKVTGRSRSQVSHVKNSRLGKHYLLTLVRLKEQGAMQDSLVGLSLEGLRRTLDDRTARPEDRLRAIENVLDREPSGQLARRVAE